jgi:hypothetical protein
MPYVCKSLSQKNIYIDQLVSDCQCQFQLIVIFLICDLIHLTTVYVLLTFNIARIRPYLCDILLTSLRTQKKKICMLTGFNLEVHHQHGHIHQ